MEVNSKSKISRSRFFKSTQIFIVASTILLALIVTILCIGLLMRYERDNDVSSIKSVSYWNDKLTTEQMFWYKKGIEELWTAISLRTNRYRTKNVIIFMANGFNPEILAAVRLNNSNNATAMSWDQFPYLGMLKHDCSNADLCDSLGIATALFGGVRTSFRLGGLDSSVPLMNCSAALNKNHFIESILEMAQKAGKRTGLITTGRVTAASIAALYANVAESNWECENFMPKGKIIEGCSDIARQLVENATGSQINVIMGGGRQTLVSHVPITEMDPIDEQACNSDDERNLIKDWVEQKLFEKKSYAVLSDADELKTLNGSQTDYVLGIFSNGNLQRNFNRTPTLGAMVDKSISVLKRRKKNYMLIVNEEVKPNTESKLQMQILREFNEVIEKTLDVVKQSQERTLFLILFNNDVPRSISEITQTEVDVDINSHSSTKYDDVMENFKPDSLMYAQGPQSYLFQGMHDNIYLAHAVSFAMQMGPYNRKKSN